MGSFKKLKSFSLGRYAPLWEKGPLPYYHYKAICQYNDWQDIPQQIRIKFVKVSNIG
jgi:hypothetical protein